MGSDPKRDAAESIGRVNAVVKRLKAVPKPYQTIAQTERDDAMNDAFIAIADALTDVGVVVGLDVKDADEVESPGPDDNSDIV